MCRGSLLNGTPKAEDHVLRPSEAGMLSPARNDEVDLSLTFAMCVGSVERDGDLSRSAKRRRSCFGRVWKGRKHVKSDLKSCSKYCSSQ